MSDSQLNETTVGSHDLSSAGRSRLSGLLAGLDRLAEFQSLPTHPAAADPPLPFGRFLLRSRLGSGAHGLVLLADDPLHNRQVAVKVPQPAVLTDDELSERFVREARAAGSLDHPGIVPVYESGVRDGVPFLVAGFVPGPSLAQWLDDHPGPVPPPDAVRFVAELADAVQHAHERGVLHCDLTPTNILLHPTPPAGDRIASYRPAITDFGLARLMSDDPARTRTFRIAGTPRYMAPEQVRGERRDLTARADIYSLGAILYQLVTGRTPFDGAGSEEVMRQVLTAAPACPRTWNPRLPRDLAAVCLKCLDKDPQQRYRTAAAFADDLTRFLTGLPVNARRLAPFARSARWVRRNPWRASAAAVVCGLGVALATLWAEGVRHAAEVRTLDAARSSAEDRAAAGEFVATVERISRRRNDREPDWPSLNLADLRHLATAAVAAEHQPLLRTEAAAALAGIDLGVPRAVAEGFKAYAPAFSPDGKTLALGSWSPSRPGFATVRLLDPVTGVEQRTLSYPTDSNWEERYAASKKIEVGNIDGCKSLTFSPNGRWLVVGTRSGCLVRWDLSAPQPTGVRWRHTRPTLEPRQERIERVAFTPGGLALASTDGRQIAVWDTKRKWAEAWRSDGALAGIVRPARFDDRLFVQVGTELLPIRESAPWRKSATVGDFEGMCVAAGPRAELLLSNRNHRTVWPFAPPIPPRVSGDEMPPFVAPDESQTDSDVIENIAVSPDGLHLATGVEQLGHLRLWSVASGRLLSERTLRAGSLRLTFSPDSRALAVCTEDRTLLFDIPAPPVLVTTGVQPYPLADAEVRPGKAALLGVVPSTQTVLRTGQLRRGGWVGSEMDRTVFGPPDGNNGWKVAVAAEGEVAHTSTAGVWVFPPEVHPRYRPAENLTGLAYGPTGRLWGATRGLSGWGRDGSVVQVAMGKVGKDPQPTCLASAGEWLLAGRSDGAVVVIEERTGTVTQTVPVFDQAITALVPADDRCCVAGDAFGAVRKVDLRTGSTLVELPTAHRDAVTALAHGPRGWFATGSRDRTVKVWDPTGRPVLTLPQTRPVRRVFWSEDGRTLTILAEGERGLRQWDIARLNVELANLGLDPRLP